MAGFFESFKQAMNEELPGEHYVINDARITCKYCGNDIFEKSRVQLNTAGITFVDVNWADKQAFVLACSECGHMEWFTREPQEI